MSAPDTHPDNNALLKQYSPLVRRLAKRMMVKLPPSVEIDDLIQVGMLGLTEALTRFEAAQGVQFETFATQRIRGAMIDELREVDWISRRSRRSQKEIDQVVHLLEQRLGRHPSESEIATQMKCTLAEFQDLVGRVRGTQLVYLEDLTASADDEEGFLDRHVCDQDADPMLMLRNRRKQSALIAAINVLPKREQHVMSMYYEQDMNLKDIAAVLGVTESRVCQLHGQSIAKLRSNLKAH